MTAAAGAIVRGLLGVEALAAADVPEPRSSWPARHTEGRAQSARPSARARVVSGPLGRGPSFSYSAG